jgi:hypothetical protein
MIDCSNCSDGGPPCAAASGPSVTTHERSDAQVRLGLSRTSPAGLRALVWAGLLALALCVPGARDLQALDPLGLDPLGLDPLGLDAAVDEVRSALEDMAGALNAAPQRVQITTGPDLHLMSGTMARAVDRLESDAVPVADPSLVYDLNLLADIARAATEELRATVKGSAAAFDPARAQRIDRLTEAASARLVEVNLVIDGWTERSRNAVVQLAEEGGALVLRSTDRLVYDGIRYTGITLLLVGLLVVGLQLLRMSEHRANSPTLVRKTPVLSSLAIAALLVFFVGCAVFSARPEMLAALSAEVRSQPQEHPCDRLAAQRDRLAVAQEVEHPTLIAATKQRMLPAARDCLGLPSEAATAEALDLLAAKTTVAWSTPRLMRPRQVAMAPADLDPGAADMAALSLPTTDQEPAGTTRNGHAEAAELERLADAPVAATADRAAEPEPATEPDPELAAAVLPLPDPRRRKRSPGLLPPDPRPAQASPELRPSEPAGPAGGLDGLMDGGPESPQPELYVTTSRVNYRAGPSLDAPRLGTFIIGAQLEVVSEDRGWAEVRLRDGRDVYVASKFLELAR